MSARIYRAGRGTALTVYVVCLSILLLTPLIVVVAVSVNSAPYTLFPPTGFSLKWFGAALGNADFLSSLWLSIRVAVTTALLSLLIGVPASLALARYRFRGKPLVNVFAMGPMAIPEIMLALGLLIMFIRVPVGPSFNELVLGHLIVCLPLCIQVLSSTAAKLDANLEAAAATLGANAWQRFRRVTLPLMKPGVIGGGLLAFIFSFDNISISLFLAQPGQVTLPVRMYLYLDSRADPTIAAMSTVLIAISVVGFVIANRMGALSHLAGGKR